MSPDDDYDPSLRWPNLFARFYFQIAGVAIADLGSPVRQQIQTLCRQLGVGGFAAYDVLELTLRKAGRPYYMLFSKNGLRISPIISTFTNRQTERFGIHELAKNHTGIWRSVVTSFMPQGFMGRQLFCVKNRIRQYGQTRGNIRSNPTATFRTFAIIIAERCCFKYSCTIGRQSSFCRYK